MDRSAQLVRPLLHLFRPCVRFLGRPDPDARTSVQGPGRGTQRETPAPIHVHQPGYPVLELNGHSGLPTAL
jgi:hypothetical protein